MIELNGKYASAKIFTDLVDGASISQVQTLLGQKFVEGSQVRMMPDIHAGAGCTIGTTMTITSAVCPNLVGVDIGCGMLVIPLAEKEIDLPMLDDVIRKYIPSGFSKRDKAHVFAFITRLNELRCKKHVNIPLAEISIGTLGGGNHFIEVDRDDEDNLYLVIHTGSRHLGLEVANYYQNLAGGGELDYLSGSDFDDYIHDMKIVQEFAQFNRDAIADEILDHANIACTYGEFESIHNYIDTDNMILRKGSVSAKAGEKLLIPINMRDGSLICIGKGNPDWNYSAPHGAGRLMSRSAAKKRVSMTEYKKTMKEAGVYTTSVNKSTLDESPMAYKPMEEIINNIKDTVEIIDIIKPIYNFKAGEE